jgi:hypothetical protein
MLARMKRIAERRERGTAEASGYRSRIIRVEEPERTIPASGLVAPLHILVVVRAMAPVAANPLNRGATGE